MNSAAIQKIIIIVFSLLLVQLLAGCAPAVSQEQFNSVQAELKSTKEQLASTKAELESLKSQIAVAKGKIEAIKSAWSSTQPYLELSTLYFENWATLGLQNSKAITTLEANTLYTDQSSRFEGIMKKFSDAEFVNALKSAWYVTPDNPQWEKWYKGYDKLRSNLKENADKFAGQLNQ